METISLKIIDGRIIDGTAKLNGKNRVSEIFTDTSILFIELLDTIDNTGTMKKNLFINKNLVIWVKPKEIITTTSKEYLEKTHYKNISVKTSEGVIIDGKINMLEFQSLHELFKNTATSPFIIMRDAIDSNENKHHTLFINKISIIHIEEI